MNLTLRRLREDEEAEFLSAMRATAPDFPTFAFHWEEGTAFGDYLRMLDAWERGEVLPGPRVPTTLLFAFVGDRIVGRSSIRHELDERLARVGGHIGYGVVPEFRRRGYATEILRQSLEFTFARLGLERVLVTCDDDNVGSIRTIERNGGVLESTIADPDLRKPKRRYWITRGGDPG